MKKKMEEYQNALEEMSGEAVEYVRGIPVVKTFGQSVFSFKRFRDSIKKYEKWTISYTKDLRLPMMGYTVAINSVFAILIAAVYLLGGVKSGTADPEFLLNLLFYIIITPIITVTLTKMMYAGENTMVVEDALARIDNIIERKPLPQEQRKRVPKMFLSSLNMYLSGMTGQKKMPCTISVFRSVRESISLLSDHPVEERQRWRDWLQGLQMRLRVRSGLAEQM